MLRTAFRTKSTDDTASVLAPDPALVAVRDRLESLDQHCLTDLEGGLRAMAEGDLTREVRAVTEPIELVPDDPFVSELVGLFDRMLTRVQASLASYEALRADLRRVLGDESCLAGLEVRLQSLSDNCLVSLGEGLDAMADGDLTREATPVTEPLPRRDGVEPGVLAEVFNEMLARAQGGLGAYNTTRQRVAAMIGEISGNSDTVARAANEMSRTSQETGAAIEQIAAAMSEVAVGATRQVQLVASMAGVADEATEQVGTARQVADEGVSFTADIAAIADQTNLLALNAAIEAARAGEQGRGSRSSRTRFASSRSPPRRRRARPGPRSRASPSALTRSPTACTACSWPRRRSRRSRRMRAPRPSRCPPRLRSPARRPRRSPPRARSSPGPPTVSRSSSTGFASAEH